MHSLSHSRHRFTFPTVGLPQLLRTKKNDKNTILEESDEKHYYYSYIIPRQLIYSGTRIFIPSSADSSTTLAMDLPLLLAMTK